MIYDRALSDTEITDIYEIQKDNFFKTRANNIWNGTRLDTYNITINSNVYESSGLYATTDLLRTNTSNHTLTFTKEDYLSTVFSRNGTTTPTLEVGQTNVTITATTKYGNQDIQSFTLETENGDFSTTNGVLTFQPNQGSYLWNLTTDLYFNRTNQSFTIDDTQEVYEFTNMTNSLVQFLVKQTGDPITNNITLTYVNGTTFDLETNSSGHVEVAGQEINNRSVFNLTFLDLGGYLTPITFPFNLTSTFNGSKNISIVDMNFNIYDYESGVLLNQSATVTLVNYFQATTSNGTLTIENATISDGEIGIYVDSAGYLTNQRQFIYDNQESVTIDIYLKNESITDLGKLFTYTLDENFYAIKNADTRLQRYDPDEGDFVEVEQCFTNSNGECIFNIILGDELYIVTTTATRDGLTASTQSSETGNFYPVDNTEIELYLEFQEQFSVPDDFGLIVNAFNTELDGNTSNLYATFSDVGGNTHTVCIAYMYYEGFVPTLYDETCTTGATGSVGISDSFELNRSYTWTAEIYTKQSDTKLKTYYSYRYAKETSFENIFVDYLELIIIVLIILALSTALLTGNIVIFPIGMIFITIFAGVVLPAQITPLMVAFIIFINIMIIYMARKRSDNEAT